MMNKSNEKIVKTGIKVDFHIHSCASRHKESKGKVDDSTIENLKILVDKLNSRQINMCAISDHDNFDIEIYKKLKKYEHTGTLKKVLPAVEFTVVYDSTTLHIITIFDDADANKLEKIQDLIFDKKYSKPKYKGANAFTEEQFLEIIKKIDLDVIMIAHQKESLFSAKTRKNDVMSLGEEKFKELVFIDYFESFEFKNKRNEIFNKSYIDKNKKKFANKDLRFITGSDCHIWKDYPNEDETFKFTYLKCLPTFRGVAMAVTSCKRIKLVNSFFSKSNKVIEKIEIKTKDKKLEIPMSAGINVIIGDNSIGKSLLVHKLTNYKYLEDVKLKKSYDNYLKSNKINIVTTINENLVSVFNGQGAIRRMFENKAFNMYDFFENYFPNNPNTESYKNLVIKEMERYKTCQINKKEYNDSQKNISDLVLQRFDEIAMTLYIEQISINYNDRIAELNNIVNKLDVIIDSISALLNNKFVFKSDKKALTKNKQLYQKIKDRYLKEKQSSEVLNNKVNVINSVLTQYNKRASNIKTDATKEIGHYQQSISDFENRIVYLYLKSKNETLYKPNLASKQLPISVSEIGQYRFIKKSNIDEISNEYIVDTIKEIIGKKIKNINSLTEDKLPSKIKGNNFNEKMEDVCRQLLEKINKDFDFKSVINNKTDDIKKELSPGFNSKIYFDILSNQTHDSGIFIFDQPEDDLSQKSIKDYILDDFYMMSQYRQIILITHNPQFIVNLDVDNVIYLTKDGNGSLVLQNGALEFEDANYNMLKIIADNIDGGVDAINERWKRYEKNI